MQLGNESRLLAGKIPAQYLLGPAVGGSRIVRNDAAVPSFVQNGEALFLRRHAAIVGDAVRHAELHGA
ncbi:hypothetical protein SD70_13905 [Gordoniibacillus kamchatkensis]|uniref:Uncharacterized protein n=1 Tax=Gordoniibacillus kamchatkensis TaxID=1590651 RepID=A0ABR5AH59_9BACL|nr:hypothetical protein SD70_13905 [Paenibacillus sp. VKM B-2647]